MYKIFYTINNKTFFINVSVLIFFIKDYLYKLLFIINKMKVLYVESRLKDMLINLDKEEISKLPKKLFLVYTIQYKTLIPDVKILLEENNIKVTGTKQVLGCSRININDQVLFVGNGKFHIMNLYSQVKEIYLLENNRIQKVSSIEIESMKNKLKGSMIKFLSANNIGILVSTKPGQANIKLAIRLKHTLEKKGKNAFIFISNNIDTEEFVNFPIDIWINTACIGLYYDSPGIINYNDLVREKLI
jgi:2-(3-amino-3-carboxypropyl)histidine synthase